MLKAIKTVKNGRPTPSTTSQGPGLGFMCICFNAKMTLVNLCRCPKKSGSRSKFAHPPAIKQHDLWETPYTLCIYIYIIYMYTCTHTYTYIYIYAYTKTNIYIYKMYINHLFIIYIYIDNICVFVSFFNIVYVYVLILWWRYWTHQPHPTRPSFLSFVHVSAMATPLAAEGLHPGNPGQRLAQGLLRPWPGLQQLLTVVMRTKHELLIVTSGRSKTERGVGGSVWV